MRPRLLLLAGLLSAILLVHNAFAATNFISGTISNSTTWSGTNLLTGTVVVTNGATVNIEPGTRLLMNTAATLVVYGQLLANGTSNAPIVFTRSTTTTNWSRIRFVQASNSVFRHCLIEFANSTGDHQSYYDNDCNTNTPPLPRNYREAIVALGTHLDIENCTFQNLPSNTGARDGDALAIISDDIQFPGTASATVRGCRFVTIGQAVHTRFSYVLVENCFFSDKRGDNDDIDMYGESVPVPLIRNNLFLSGHEDKINPTRCSAIIVNNIIMGSDDHGIVLRDAGRPVVMNNFIFNCTSAGISVQNQCDALIANNTIVNSQRGIRLFDHFDRHGPPYCLFPGSGRATVVNNIIWDCPRPFELTDSPDGHSYVNASYSNIEGGQAASSVSANATLVWGPGNINADPRFVNLATNNYRLLSNSPSIDAGTNILLAVTNFSVGISNDIDGTARPLDGNGDGLARFDMGAHEFLLATADSNGDGIPDGWAQRYGFNAVDPNLGEGNADNDGHTNEEEWIADTNPTNALSGFNLINVAPGTPTLVTFPSSSNRQYTLYFSTNLVSWTNVTGQVDVPGSGGVMSLSNAEPPILRFYKVAVELP